MNNIPDFIPKTAYKERIDQAKKHFTAAQTKQLHGHKKKVKK